MNQMKHKVDRSILIQQNKVRRRAQTSVADCFKLVMIMTPFNYRSMIRELNNSIGMKAYEVIGPVQANNNRVNVEMYVPGKDLALLLKLKWAGQ